MPASVTRVEDLSGRVYDAAVDPSLWGGILSDLTDLTGGIGSSHMVSDIRSGDSEVVWSRHLDPSPLDAFHSYYAAINPLILVPDIATYRAAWRPTMMRDEDWMERSALERSEYFSDFLRPLKLSRGLFIRLGLDGTRLTTISIGRGPAQDHFSDRTMARLAPFHRHAVRAARLGGRFADMRRFSVGATAAMDAVSEALMMLGADGRIVHANAAAERMMTKGTMVDSVFGRLRGVAPRSSASLAAAIDRAGRPGDRAGGSVTLIGADGQSASEAAVIPIGLAAGMEAAAGPAVLVRIGGDRAREGFEARFERFGLTRAERALVLLLLEGSSLRQAAAARGVSFHTARSQLAGVFDKTGVHRQAELVALLNRDE